MRTLLFFVDVPGWPSFLGWVESLDVPRRGDRVCLHDADASELAHERYAGTRDLVAEWEGTVIQVRHDVTLTSGQLSISQIRVHVLADPIPETVSASLEEYQTWLASAGWEYAPSSGPRPDRDPRVRGAVPVDEQSDGGATGRLGLTVLDFPE